MPEGNSVGFILWSFTVSSLCINNSLILRIPLENSLGAVKTPFEGIYEVDIYGIALTWNIQN